MRDEADWARWGDEHPWLAGFAQLGVYLLCWVGFLAGLALALFLISLVAAVLDAS